MQMKNDVAELFSNFFLMGNVNCWEVAGKQLLEYGALQHVL